MLPTGGDRVQETISLYIGLKPGEKADFEVVGLAAAAFAEMVKEIAFFQDPFTEVRLEFESGLEGSLELKAVLKTLASGDGRKGLLIGVISTVCLVLVNDVRTYGVEKLLDHYLLPQQRQSLSDEDIQRIAKAVKDANEGKVAKSPTQRMYRQLDRDPTIESVGSITKPNSKPVDPIPRSEFQIRAGLAPTVDPNPRSRTAITTDLLTLISPVLLDADRIWRFDWPLASTVIMWPIWDFFLMY